MKLAWTICALATASTVLPCEVCSAEIYRWIDAAGGEHYSSALGSVPPAHRAAAEASAGSVGPRATLNRIDARPEEGSADRGGARAARPGDRRAAARPLPEEDRVGGHGESWWRASVQRFVDEIAALEAHVEACKDLKPPRRYESRGRMRMKRLHYQACEAAVQRCSARQSTLEAKLRQLAHLRERARRQGLPPGWLRER